MKELFLKFDRTFIIRLALVITMIMHGITSFTNLSVLEFGKGMEGLFGFMGTPIDDDKETIPIFYFLVQDFLIAFVVILGYQFLMLYAY
jgi:uncharacterized membrane protein YphA (DoxX/SURF4 family)